MPHLYAIAIGSNRPHGRFGRPPGVVEAAIARLDEEFGLFDASPIVLNAAHGGAGRDFANAVALVESDLEPPDMLARLKAIEREFGRRARPPLGPARARPRHRSVERRRIPVAAPEHSAPATRRAQLRPSAAGGDRAGLAGAARSTSAISPTALPAGARAGNRRAQVGP